MLQPSTTRPLSARSICHPAGAGVTGHHHRQGQLAIVIKGTMTLCDDRGWWLAPPGQGIWVPPDVTHEARYSEQSLLIQLLIDPLLGPRSQGFCQTMPVSNLLRELALEAVRLDAGDEGLRLIAKLVIREIERPKTTPVLYVPHGQDRRLRRVIERLQRDPGLNDTLEDLAGVAGSSPRTLARLFLAETGMSFSRWRDHLRIVTAVNHLARGQTITQTAMAVGYQSSSSFTTMFTRILGMPPSRYIRKASI